MPPPMRRASWTWSAFSGADAQSAGLTARNRTDKKPAALERVGGLFRSIDRSSSGNLMPTAGIEMKR